MNASLFRQLHTDMGTYAVDMAVCYGYFIGKFVFCTYRGTNISRTHGIPIDLLDVIIRTETYGPADMIQILAILAQVAELIDEESLAYLGEIGQHASLRHVVQLLSPASIVAKDEWPRKN